MNILQGRSAAASFSVCHGTDRMASESDHNMSEVWLQRITFYLVYFSYFSPPFPLPTPGFLLHNFEIANSKIKKRRCCLQLWTKLVKRNANFARIFQSSLRKCCFEGRMMTQPFFQGWTKIDEPGRGEGT